MSGLSQRGRTVAIAGTALVLFLSVVGFALAATLPPGGPMMLGVASYHVRARDRFEILPSIVVVVVAALDLTAINAS